MVDTSTVRSCDLFGRRHVEALAYAGSAVRKDASMIGWLPWQFYEQHDKAGRLVMICRNGDLVGFCAWTEPDIWGVAKIVQTWVQADARMIEHGRALLERVAWDAAGRNAIWLSCWVAEDLDAMRFWPAIGFQPVGRRLGKGDIVDLQGRRMLTQFCRRVMSGAEQPKEPKPCLMEPTKDRLWYC